MKVETTLTFAELAKMAPADLFKQAAFAVKVSKAVETAKDRFDETLQFSAKVVAAMKRRYQAQINAREIPPDTKFNKYFGQNAGGVCPGRVGALSELFNALVLTLDKNGKPLLVEEVFDNAAVDWLEKANAIINKAQKDHGENWKGCDEVLDTINALSKPGNAAKKLTEIRKRQKGESKSDGDTSGMMTPEQAAEMFMAAIKKAGEMPIDRAANLYHLTVKLNDAWVESGVDDDTLNQWANNINKGVAPEIEVITEPQAVAA